MTAFIIISTIMIKMATNVDDAFGGYFRYWVYFSDLPSPSSDAGVLADFYFVGLLIYYSKKVSWDLLDVVLIGGAVLFIGGVMVHFWLTSKDALLASLNTLYPGKRVSTGGKWTIGEFFLSLQIGKFLLKISTIRITLKWPCSITFSNCIPSKSICVIWQKDSEQKLLGRILMIFVCFLSFGLPLGCQNG